MIDRVKARWFMAYETLDVDLTGLGMRTIQGPNGAGKSTIAEAVFFAFFGKALRSGVTGLKHLRSRHAGDEPTEVEVTARRNGETRRVIRSISAAGRTSLRFLGETDDIDFAQADRTDLQETIVQWLGWSYDLARAALLFTPSTFQFATAGDAERKRLFSEVLGQGVYESAAEIAKGDLGIAERDLTRFSTEQDAAQDLLGTILDMLRVNRKSAEEWDGSRPEQRAELVARREAWIEAHRARLEAVTAQLEQWERDHADRLVEIEAEQSTWDTARTERVEAAKRRQLEAIEAAREEHAEVKAQFERFEREQREERARYEKKKEEASTLATRRASMEQERADLSSRIASERSTWVAMRQELSDEATRLRTAHKAACAETVRRRDAYYLLRDKGRQVGDPCPTCTFPLDEERFALLDGALVEEAKAARDVALEQEIQLENDKVDAERALATHEKAEPDATDLTERVDALTNQLAELGTGQFEEILAWPANPWEPRLETLERLLEAGPLSPDVAAIEAETNPYAAQRKRVESETNPHVETHRHIRDETNPHDAELDRFDREVNPFRRNVSEWSDQLTAAKEKLASLKDSVRTATNRVEALRFWSVGFGRSGIQSLLLDHAVPTLNQSLETYCGVLFGGQVLVQLSSVSETAKGEQRDKIDLLISSPDGDSYQLCSSGERARVNLALYCALHDVVTAAHPSLGLLFVDEGFDALDADGAACLVRLLQMKRERGARTVLVVTHSPDIAALFEDGITLDRKRGEAATVVIR